MQEYLPVENIPIVLALVAVVLYGVWCAYRFKTRATRGKVMLRKEQLKVILADMYVDALLELHANGQLTAKEVNDELIKYAKQRGLWDLVPVQLIKEPDQDSLKERLRKKFARTTPEDTADNPFAALLVANLK